MITNTHSVGSVHQATIAWRIRQGEPDATGYWWALPVVACLRFSVKNWGWRARC